MKPNPLLILAAPIFTIFFVSIFFFLESYSDKKRAQSAQEKVEIVLAELEMAQRTVIDKQQKIIELKGALIWCENISVIAQGIGK